MAEIVGVAASGISIATFAVQIASAIVKLKSYWDELKDIPEVIRLLTEELEELSILLSDIEEDLRRNPISMTKLDSNSALRCLEYCRRGAVRLQETTNDLGTDIVASHGIKINWVSARTMIRKDKIARYKSRLESSVRLLSLSYQFYTRSVVYQSPRGLRQMPTSYVGAHYMLM